MIEHQQTASFRKWGSTLLLLAVQPFHVFCASDSTDSDKLLLAEQGRSIYRIVTAQNPSPSTRFAAEELQRFLKEISGAELSIVTDAVPPSNQDIMVGDSRHLRRVLPEFEVKAYGEEGYLLRVIDDYLIIAGGQPRGDLYGVYGFLQDHLGCRWFTPQISKIPGIDRLEIPRLDERDSPAFEYREVMLFDCWDTHWIARNRLSTSSRYTDPALGGTVRFVPGYFVHTFEKFLPPEKYFDEHPEYYSEVQGVRLRSPSQLCATNAAVAQIITERVCALFREHPGASVISISQNDGNKHFCQCENCAALDKKEGSHAAQVLFLVNRVAGAVEKEFPDRAIETLAYEWSQAAPRTMRPRDNVIVRLSTIRCSFSRPIRAERGRNRAFRDDLEAWSKVSRRLWIWNYNTYFSWYLIPFPDWRVLDDNLRFFKKNGVTGVLEQNNWHSVGSDLAPLKGYLLARLLWDPDFDRDRVINEFLQEVYGPAAPHVQAYLDLLSDKVEQETIDLGIYGSRTPKWLSGDVLEKADAIWQNAEAAVSDQPEILARVRVARLNTDYAIIEKYRWKPENMVVYEGDPRKGKVLSVDLSYAERIRRFLEVSQKAGITHLREGEPDAAANAEWLQSLLKASE